MVFTGGGGGGGRGEGEPALNKIADLKMPKYLKIKILQL